PPAPTPFPYTTLFRSQLRPGAPGFQLNEEIGSARQNLRQTGAGGQSLYSIIDRGWRRVTDPRHVRSCKDAVAPRRRRTGGPARHVLAYTTSPSEVKCKSRTLAVRHCRVPTPACV